MHQTPFRHRAALPPQSRSLAAALLLLSCLVASGPLIAGDEVIRLSEPVSTTATTETFGAALPAGSPVLELGELLENPAAHLGQSITVATRIARVCQKKGCFFIAQQGKHSIRVAFRDYSFFIPTDAGGKDVLLAGTLIAQERSAATAQHLQQDLAQGDAVPTGLVYELEAFAIEIPKGSVAADSPG